MPIIATKDTLLKAATDFEFFCEHILKTPQKEWKKKPSEAKIIESGLKLTNTQKEYVKYISNTEIQEKVVLKCRQRGYTTVTITWLLWNVLYGKNYKCMYVTNKAENAAEIYATLTTIIHKLDAPYVPSGMAYRRNPQYVIQNEKRNNKIVIRTATEDAGRSGTFSCVVLDEVAAYDTHIQKEISAAIVAACNNRIVISTPRKENDLFHIKTIEADKRSELWIDKYWDHAVEWFGSEENAKLWRRAQEQGNTHAQISRELDCQFRGAADDLILFVPPTAIQTYSHKQGQRIIVSLDLGFADDTCILYAADVGNKLHIFDENVVNKTTITDITDIIKKKYGRSIKYGVMDCSGKKVDMTSGSSVYAMMQRLLMCPFRTRKNRKEEMLLIGQKLISDQRVYIDPGCVKLLEMCNNYEWINGKMPHDRLSHIFDSFIYLLYNWSFNSITYRKPQMIERGYF